MDKLGRKIGMLALASGVCLAAAACNEHPLKDVSAERLTESGGTVAVTQNKDVDILFVIDNSGSMGEEQATLAANFDAFIAQLEDSKIDANYRIAVTTTDANHFHCAGGEDGRFQMSSCRSRPGDFQRPGTTDDFFDESCLAVCDLDSLETTPTATLLDPEMKPRPWIESIGGVTNLPEGVTATQAFQCVGPQGVSGCGYESPLESMRRSLTRANTENEPEYGFIRPGAILAVVFVTDEADCSARWTDISDPWDADGERTFWSDGTDGYPRSEVCWKAGTTCQDAGGGTKECDPANKDALGLEADDEDAVLYPVTRYTDFLQAIEDQKRAVDAAADLDTGEVLVAVIGGVPPGYTHGQEIPYRSGQTPQDVAFEAENGIAPGCRTEGIGEAVPPVRLRDFAAAFETNATNPNNLFSVCQSDYTPALENIVDLIKTQVRQACVPVCVEDTDPLTDTIEHNCIVNEVVAGREDTLVPPCTIDDDAATVPEGSDLCYVSLSDKANTTPATIDDLHPDCIEAGWNLQLKIVRRDGLREAPGTAIQATCSSSPAKSLDCPDL